jgi:hypothetical protein
MAYISPDYSNFEMLAVFSDGAVSVGNLLQIKNVKVACHGDNQSYIVTLEESIATGVLRTFEINFTDFNTSQEAANQIFNKNGYVLSSFKYTNHLREYIAQEIQDRVRAGQVDYYHTNLGFTIMSDGTKRFLLGDTTYKGKTSTFVDRNFKFRIGTKQEYKGFLDEHILPYTETRLALAIGLSSVASSDLMEYGDIGTMVLNFTGQSSTGKTTIIQFMASLWGSPRISNFGIVRTFNATTNSLVQTFTGTNGVPIIIDDATSLGVKDLASFIYNVSAGEDKLRLTQDIQLRESKGKWSGLVTISSETSILEHSTKTGGSIPRLLEFDNITWTQSAHHAKVIKRNIAKSFGHLGRDFIHHYSQKTLSQRKALFDACEDELDQLITTRDQYSGRIISKLAIIYMTAKLIEEFFQYSDFSADEIRDHLVEFENGKVPVRSIESQALDIIKTFIIRNQHRMAYKVNKAQLMELVSNGDFIGYKEYISETIIEVTVISQVIAKELSQHNIYQWSNVLRYLEKKSFVKTYGKNDKVSEKDNYLKVKAITFRFHRDANDELMRWYFTDRGLSPEDKKELKKAPINYEDKEQIDAIFED